MDAISAIGQQTSVEANNNVTKPTAAELQQQKVMKELSAVVTNQLFGEVLKDQMNVGMGDGMQADFYSSMLVNAVSEQLAETDALGLASFLEKGLPE